MTLRSRAISNFLPVLFLAFVTIFLSSCKIVYMSEDFSLTIDPEGKGDLVIDYVNFGSSNMKPQPRKKDLALLKGAPRNKTYEQQAKEMGVNLKMKRLELVNFGLNGHLEASADDFQNLFKFFTHYKIEMDEAKIYIIPQNEALKRATVSEGGMIVERGGKVAFAWPLGTPLLGFKASYDQGYATFSYDLQKQYSQ